jgi:hypothetical protein
MESSWAYGDGPAEKDPKKITEFRSIASSISYFAQCTRPDITLAISKLMSHMHHPNESCYAALKRLCIYLRFTHNHGLCFRASKDTPKLYAFCDASWNSKPCEKGRSTSGNLIYFGPNLIDWSSKRQEIIALSPAESEQNAAFHTAKSLMYFRYLLDELGYTQDSATAIYEDNTACIAQSKNPINHQRTRHINLRYNYLRDLTEMGHVYLTYVPTKQQLADVLTKPLEPKLFIRLTQHFMQPS